jgi:HAD superfamily hydrolase (TIGR01490 family)
MKPKTIAFFDFCDTLIGMQTANKFISLCYIYNKRIDTVLNEFIRMIGRKTKILFGYKHKIWQLKQIKGLNEEEMKEIVKIYVEKELIPRENKKIVEKLLWHKKRGDEIAIVSGGFSEYIKYYAKIYGIDYVIATDLEIKNDVYTGKIKGIDCMGINKIKKLKEVINLNEYDLKSSYAYSDHISDIPLLSLVGNPFVVNFGQDIEWAKIMEYKIIDV